MNQSSNPTVVTQMTTRERRAWTPESGTKKLVKKRLLRNTTVFAAVSLCLGIGALMVHQKPQGAQSVMSHVTAGFEYDDSLGRLQFVSHILPESAMVFLQGGEAEEPLFVPTNAQVSHGWTEEEPWLEYDCIGDVRACQDGEIMTVVKNRQNAYTVRVLHENGCESIYSGLRDVHIREQDTVQAGQQLGTAAGTAAFEWRKDGLSVMPVFAEI